MQRLWRWIRRFISTNNTFTDLMDGAYTVHARIQGVVPACEDNSSFTLADGPMCDLIISGYTRPRINREAWSTL